MVLAIDDVADPPDREAKKDAGCSGVRTEADRQMPPDAGDETTEHTAHRAAPDRNATLPDEKDLDRIGEIEVPPIDHGDEPRTEDAADHAPRRDGSCVLFGDAITNEP